MLGAIHLSGDVFINVMCTVALFSCAVFSCVRKRMVRTGFRNYKPAGRKGGGDNHTGFEGCFAFYRM